MGREAGSFSANDRVQHHIYGLGTISMIDEAHTIIEFDKGGRKKFRTGLVQLEHTDVAAPTRERARARKPKAAK